MDRRLKIAHVITRMDYGGAPDVVRALYTHQNRQHAVTLISGPSENLSEKTDRFLRALGNKAVILSCLKRAINPFYDFCALMQLVAVFQREKFDLVHLHTSKAGFLGRVAAKMTGTKNVYMPHGHVFSGYFTPRISRTMVVLEKLAAPLTGRLLTFTRQEAESFTIPGIMPDAKVIVVRPGLEPDAFIVPDEATRTQMRNTLGLSQNLVVGMVSRLEPVKGSGDFIDAAIRICRQRDRIQFLLAGSGSLSETLKKRVRETHLEERIRFLGWRDDIRDVMTVMDILVQPSLNEAVGTVLLEAHALGVATIATRVGGLPEIIRDKETGILVEPQQSEALAQAILALADDPEKRAQLAKNALCRLKEQFTLEQLVENLEKIYAAL